MPDCRPSMMYKGALQDESNITYRETRTAWMEDMPIRAEATDTDTCELNRNPLFTEGVRVDAVPDLEIEIDEIAGVGHAVTVSRFDEG